jgi:hypothetical protein
VKVVFTLAAIDDLRHIGPSAVPKVLKVLKEILLLEQDAHTPASPWEALSPALENSS